MSWPPLTRFVSRLPCSNPSLSDRTVHHCAGLIKGQNTVHLEADDFVFSNCYQGIIHLSRASLNPAVLDFKNGLSVSLTHTVYLQRYASPAVIHTAIQCTVAIVNNAVAIKIFCCVQLHQLWLSPPSLLLPFCLFL